MCLRWWIKRLAQSGHNTLPPYLSPSISSQIYFKFHMHVCIFKYGLCPMNANQDGHLQNNHCMLVSTWGHILSLSHSIYMHYISMYTIITIPCPFALLVTITISMCIIALFTEGHYAGPYITQHAKLMSGLIWIQTVWHPDGVPERIFWKRWFWKKISADDKKACKIIQQLPLQNWWKGSKSKWSLLYPDITKMPVLLKL